MENEINSAWDGWDKQCFNTGFDNKGASCARGWLFMQMYAHDQFILEMRVGSYIQANYDLPYSYTHPSGAELYPQSLFADAIIYANNELKLTPEQFREIDRKTQIEAAVRPLVDSVVLPETVPA